MSRASPIHLPVLGDEIVAIDESTLAVRARMSGGIYPDGLAYAPTVHKLYVSDELGRTETVIDVRTRQRIATIALAGEPGNSQYDPVTQHIFVNVQTRSELVEIDPTTDRITTRMQLPGAQGNHGLLIEPTQRRAFVACEDNLHKLLIVDLETHKVTASFEVGDNPDVLAYDPALEHLYVAAESGILAVFKASHAITPIGSGLIGPNLHVVAVDPATHKVFFPLSNVGGQPVLRIMSSGA